MPPGAELSADARARFGALLPERYSDPESHKGWIQVYTDMADLYIRHPRRRGGFLLNLIHNTAGKGQEGYTVEKRSAAFGRVPIIGWGGGELKQLYVTDQRYTPVNPVDGDSRVIGKMHAGFSIGAGRDADGYDSVSGIAFKFIQVGEGEVWGKLAYENSSSRYPTYTDPTEKFLEDAGFPAHIYSRELDARIVDLAEYCIQLAQE